MRQHALIGALVVAATGSQAAPVQLGEDELKAAVAGKTVTIDTPLGLPITVNYGANGIITGTAGTALAVYLGSAKDRGRWMVRNGKLCQKWFKWLSGDVTCLTLRQDGQKIYWRSDEGKTGTAMIETGPPVLEGAVASGLGLPAPPASQHRMPHDAAHSEPEPHSPGAVAEAPQRNARSQPEARTARVPEPPTERIANRLPPSPAPGPEPQLQSPSLVEPVREARPLTAALPAGAGAPRLVMASFAPEGVFRVTPPSLALPLPVDDPFGREAEPMRNAADQAAIGAMAHRWCLGNAFAKGPTGSAEVATTLPAPHEVIAEPSLLTVVQELAYEGELPLYEPSCLTEEPALAMMARLGDKR
ncbi:MAG: hypothetical protein AB7F78_11540 [Hyphomicrobiaceae bacterium]